MRRVLPLAAALLAAGCGDPPPVGPVAVDAIGGSLEVADPSQRSIDPAQAVRLAATVQGLVRFDAAGQIEPGLAIRWDVSDDGLYYTFRLGEDQPIDADDVARRLRAAIGPTSRNPLKPALDAIEEVVAVTPEIVEIRLSAPRPHMLELLARPELAMLASRGGTGPFRVAVRQGGSLLLEPRTGADDVAADEDAANAAMRRRVLLTAQAPAVAVVRFVRGEAELVLGGSFRNLALPRAATLPEQALRYDPVDGLFGLAFVRRDGFLGEPANRRALSMVIDRGRIMEALGRPAASARTALLPASVAEPGVPAEPDWAGRSLLERRAFALAAMAIAETTPPRLRVALPGGPGARLLFALVAADWRTIGVDAVPVGIDAPADLRLIDAAAPAADVHWYLRRWTCGTRLACSADADALLAEGRLAEADAAIAAAHLFVTLGAPIRWSLVGPRLELFQSNAHAAHPLDALREP